MKRILACIAQSWRLRRGWHLSATFDSMGRLIGWGSFVGPLYRERRTICFTPSWTFTRPAQPVQPIRQAGQVQGVIATHEPTRLACNLRAQLSLWQRIKKSA